jgi:branched-chain amino acid transport system substrate-binding protein
VLTAIKGKNPDLLYFGGIYPEGGLLIKQARELGLTADYLSGDGVIDPKFVEIAGKAAEGAFLTFSPDPKTIAGAEDFLKNYSARYGEPGPYSIYAYDAANVLLHAIQQAQGLDGRKITEAIRTLAHQGALGELRWDEKGDVLQSPYVIWVTEEGKFKEYWRPDLPSLRTARSRGNPEDSFSVIPAGAEILSPLTLS